MEHNPASVHVSAYECYECGTRIEGECRDGCPDCAGEVRNLSVPRN